jgi:3-O-methylgallate 3,4-dioxygenase
VYTGATIRNAPVPSPLPAEWYYRDQAGRLEDGADRHYPCHPALALHLTEGLTAEGFDITAVKALVGEQFEGHAYSFVHRKYMRDAPVPIVPFFLNTYYPPNVPTPARCRDLGLAMRRLIGSFPADLRVGVMASGGLSHFLVNETLDNQVVGALRTRDLDALAALPPHLLRTGSSEIRNWICVSAAIEGMDLDWLSYVPAYRSRALTGVGLCFAHWVPGVPGATGA